MIVSLLHTLVQRDQSRWQRLSSTEGIGQVGWSLSKSSREKQHRPTTSLTACSPDTAQGATPSASSLSSGQLNTNKTKRRNESNLNTVGSAEASPQARIKSPCDRHLQGNRNLIPEPQSPPANCLKCKGCFKPWHASVQPIKSASENVSKSCCCVGCQSKFTRSYRKARCQTHNTMSALAA